MLIRQPIVAGRFYPSDAEECREELAEYWPAPEARPELTGRIVGGIGPHAGWVCSGAVMGLVADALTRQARPQTAVWFGAVHVRGGPRAAILPRGHWQTPLGLLEIDATLAARIMDATELVEDDAPRHVLEHSIEVQVPFLQARLPELRIVPIMVPPSDEAATLGRVVGELCAKLDEAPIVVGSTDLTHYGPNYDFTPRGVGHEALAWARNENDRRMIDLMVSLSAEAVVAEARARLNACGSGAIAATIAACRALGATQGRLLRHTTSHEVLSRRIREPATDSVGYAGVVFVAENSQKNS